MNFNKYLMYGLVVAGCFAAENAFGRISMHFADQIAKSKKEGPTEVKLKDLNKDVYGKLNIADGTQKTLAQLLLGGGDGQSYAGLGDLTEDGAAVLHALICSLSRSVNGDDAVWKEFVEDAGNLGLLDNQNAVSVRLNAFGCEFGLGQDYALKFNQLPKADRQKAVEKATKTTLKICYKAYGLNHQDVVAIAQKLTDMKNTLSADVSGDQAENLLKDFDKLKLNAADLTFNGAKLFKDATVGSATIDYRVINAINSGAEDENLDAWARMILWCHTAHVTDGTVATREVKYRYMLQPGKAAPSKDPNDAAVIKKLNDRVDWLEKKSTAFDTMLAEEGKYYSMTGNICDDDC